MKEIKFVDVGEGITEGHLIKWLVREGDSVKEDQSVAQVETDKAVVNVPAPIGGIIKEVAPEDSILHLGDVVAAIGTPDEIKNYKTGAIRGKPSSAQSSAPSAARTASMAPVAAAPSQKTNDIIATPSVRKLAHDLNIGLSAVAGTGPGGRILENDVRTAVSGTSRASASRIPAAPAAPTAPAASAQPEHGYDSSVERVQMSMTRKAIARNMEESWKIPRATHMDLINATELWNIVSKEKPKMQKEKNIHLTFLPFIIKALVQGLKENPYFNASLDREKMEIIVKKYYNIGLAVESEDGLKVVVVKDADKKSVLQIADEISSLHDKILKKTITIEEMHGTTFTITNIGSLGGGFLAVPMINPPDVGILGVLSIRDWAFVIDGKVKVGKLLPFTVTFDHRVVDGAGAVKLGNAIKGYLEDVEFLEML